MLLREEARLAQSVCAVCSWCKSTFAGGTGGIFKDCADVASQFRLPGLPPSPVQAQMKNVKDVGIAVVLMKCINHLLMGTVRILHYVVNLGMG